MGEGSQSNPHYKKFLIEAETMLIKQDNIEFSASVGYQYLEYEASFKEWSNGDIVDNVTKGLFVSVGLSF